MPTSLRLRDHAAVVLWCTAAALWVGLAVAACRSPSSAPPASPSQALEAAVLDVLQAAAPAVQRMAADASSAVSTTSLAGASEVAILLEVLQTAAREYAALAAAGHWSDRIVPLLREAVASYERLRQLGAPLPPVPSFVRELLGGCPMTIRGSGDLEIR